jgi:hypothetical protein
VLAIMIPASEHRRQAVAAPASGGQTSIDTKAAAAAQAAGLISEAGRRIDLRLVLLLFRA